MTPNSTPPTFGNGVLPLDLDQAQRAGATLGRAFHTDPMQTALFPDEARRAFVLPLVFTAFIRGAAASGSHITTTPDHAAVAIWCPPGTDIRPLAIVRSYGLDLPRIVIRTPLSSLPVTFSFFSTLARRRQAHVPEPHWYLATLGVDPSHQARGLGTLLLQEGLSRADSQHTRAYLETETEGNVAFYQDFGFRVLEEITIKRIQLPMWLMAREPR
jgi:hypothetical protein